MILVAQFQGGELADEIDYVESDRAVEAKTAALEREASGAQRQMRGLTRLGDQHDLG